MKVILSKSKDPYANLATEEILLKDPELKEDILLIYINANTIVIGRNQNAHEEINSDFVAENNIKLVRRISGGGAVYQDLGNICFSFISENKKETYSKFLEPIIEFLQSLGLDAKFKGKNDLVVNDMKVSGNAQYKWKDRMFHHGTLLFDANLPILGSALKPNKLKLESKSIKSARQRVSNIRPLLKEDMTPEEFTQKLIDFFIAKGAEPMDIDNYKMNEVIQLASVRASKNWNYVKNPRFTVKNERRFDGGTISVLIEVEDNSIKEINFFGDFLSSVDTELVTLKFVSQEYTDQNIKKIIHDIENFDELFGKITKEELAILILANEEYDN